VQALNLFASNSCYTAKEAQAPSQICPHKKRNLAASQIDDKVINLVGC